MARGNSLADESFTFKVFYYSLASDVTSHFSQPPGSCRTLLVLGALTLELRLLLQLVKLHWV